MFKVSTDVEEFLQSLVRKCGPVSIYLYLKEQDMGFEFDDKDAFFNELSEYQRDHYADMIRNNNAYVENYIDSFSSSCYLSFTTGKELVSNSFDEIEEMVQKLDFDAEFNKLYDRGAL